MGAIGDLLATITALLPPWAVALVVVGLVVLVLPAWWAQVRQKRLKGLVRRMVRAEGQAREALIREAFATHKGPRDLVVLAEAAKRLSQHDVYARALEALEASGALPEEARRLRAAGMRETGRPVHPVEVAAIVERLLAEGAVEAARDRLREALARFPEDPDLVALRDRLGPDARQSAIH